MTAEPSYPGGVFAGGQGGSRGVGLTVEVTALGERVWHRVTEFGFDGIRYRQEEDY
jgi:hypothetical protein